MIQSKYLGRAVFLLALLPALTGQRVQDITVPLKNWATPLYWQPSQTERENAAKSGAQIQFSPTATSNTALVFVAVPPCRLVDTRGASAGFSGVTPFNGPYVQAGQTVTFPIQSTTGASTTAPSPCGAVPSAAQAYSLNLTIVPHPLNTPVNYVTMWPNGAAIPTVSTLNDQQGALVANAAIVPAGTPSGGVNVYVYGAADVIIDMNGFYAAPTDVNGNTAIGAGTLLTNNGIQNTASGANALQNNTTGNNNTAAGFSSLYANTTGSNNIAIGSQAANNVAGGNSNIHIGNQGVSTDTAVIRIGTQGTQTATSIAGIYGGSPNLATLQLVCVDANGILGALGCGTTPSSQRFKNQIADMGDKSNKLLQLRPVTFLYKPEYDDGSHALQYGLIAEEVAQIYPDMVGYDKDGQPNSVKYQSLTPMLLNEVQKLATQKQSQAEENRKLEEQYRQQTRQIHSLEERLASLEALMSGVTAVAKSAGSQ